VSDACCSPLLARHAQQAGAVYSLAYGDQPAPICEFVDWARTAGFERRRRRARARVAPSLLPVHADSLPRPAGLLEMNGAKQS
jgi:hypothetical protein